MAYYVVADKRDFFQKVLQEGALDFVLRRAKEATGEVADSKQSSDPQNAFRFKGSLTVRKGGQRRGSSLPDLAYP